MNSAGYTLGEDVLLAMDPAASEFFKDGRYELKGEGKSASMDDRITIKSDESRLIVERGRIAKVLTAAEPAATPAAASK